MGVKEVNLELGRPTVLVAERLLEQSVRLARSSGTPVLKLIHGYGSSGTGGAIKSMTSRVLTRMQCTGQIKYFIKGENFSPFDDASRKAADAYPFLRSDRDFALTNHGITIVIVK